MIKGQRLPKVVKPKKDAKRNMPVDDAFLGFRKASEAAPPPPARPQDRWNAVAVKQKSESMLNREQLDEVKSNWLRPLKQTKTIVTLPTMRNRPLYSTKTLSYQVRPTRRRTRLMDAFSQGCRLEADEDSYAEWEKNAFSGFDQSLVHWWSDERKGTGAQARQHCQRARHDDSVSLMPLLDDKAPPSSVTAVVANDLDQLFDVPAVSAAVDLSSDEEDARVFIVSADTVKGIDTDSASEGEIAAKSDSTKAAKAKYTVQKPSIKSAPTAKPDIKAKVAAIKPKSSAVKAESIRPIPYLDACSSDEDEFDAYNKANTAPTRNLFSKQVRAKSPSPQLPEQQVFVIQDQLSSSEDEDKRTSSWPSRRASLQSLAASASALPPPKEDSPEPSYAIDSIMFDDAALAQLDEAESFNRQTQPAKRDADAELMLPPPVPTHRSAAVRAVPTPVTRPALAPMEVDTSSPAVVGPQLRRKAIVVTDTDASMSVDPAPVVVKAKTLNKLKRKPATPASSSSDDDQPLVQRQMNTPDKHRRKKSKKQTKARPNGAANPFFMPLEAEESGGEAHATSEEIAPEDSSDREFVAPEGDMTEDVDVDMDRFYRESIMSQHPTAHKFAGSIVRPGAYKLKYKQTNFPANTPRRDSDSLSEYDESFVCGDDEVAFDTSSDGR